MTLLTRETLYELVWTDAVRTVAERLGVSDVWLKKCCAKGDIPVPTRGYWAKLRAGKPVMRVKLPPRAPGQPFKIQIGSENGRYWPVDIEAELAKPLPEEPAFEEPIATLRDRITKRLGTVVYRRDLSALHPFIAKLLADDEIRKRKPDNAPSRLRWSEPLFSSAFERRRLRVLSALFLALQKVGAQPWINDAEARAIGLVVGAERVGISLDHPDAKPDRDGRYKTRAGFADLLRLAITGTDWAWSDEVETALEAHLTDIAIEIIVAGETQLRANAQAGFERECKRREELAQRLVEQRAEAARQAHERKVKAEREHRRGLSRMAAAHLKAERMRSFIDDVVRARSADPIEAARVAKWARWALVIAENTDPISRLTFDDDGHATLTDAAPTPRVK